MDTIVVNDVHKTFPNGAKAVQGISLSIRKGEIFGVLGPNGAGKTTLQNMISTLLQPDRGEIYILGQPVSKATNAIRLRMNLCSGNANFAWSLTIRENLRFYAMLYGMRGQAREARIDQLIEAFALNKFADRRFDEVSTGTKQRMALAKSLLNEPEVLLLDEPTVGLDPDIAMRVRQHIRDYHERTRCTLVLTTHYMQEAQELCDRAAFVREGKILALGTPDELKAQSNVANMEAVFLELAKSDDAR
jgi:ABC-2 type transport system ATP-binding protein